MLNIITEVKYGQHAEATIYEDGCIRLFGREGGAKYLELTRQTLTLEKLISFYNGSEYLAKGLLKRIVDALPPVEEANELMSIVTVGNVEVGIIHPTEETKEEQPTMKTIYFFECNGAISLDGKYLEAIADGKGEVVFTEGELHTDVIAELKELRKRNFDGSHYHNLLENGNVHAANQYWEANHKCVNTPRYGFNW